MKLSNFKHQLKLQNESPKFLFFVGSATLPDNKLKTVKLSLIMYRNGELHLKQGGHGGTDSSNHHQAVAAAASDPFLFTSIKAFWTNADTYSE